MADWKTKGFPWRDYVGWHLNVVMNTSFSFFFFFFIKLLVLFPTVAHKFCPLDSLFKSPSDSTEYTFNPHP